MSSEDKLKSLDFTVKVTDNAIKRIQDLQNQGDFKYLILEVQGGGCSGYKYNFIDYNDNQYDVKKYTIHGQENNVQLLIDRVSIFFVSGATIDYVNSVMQSGFVVVDNPYQKSGCGCGVSFSLKE